MDRDDAVVIAVDQGSSSTKALAVAPDGTIVARAAVPVAEQHPRPGWVEQDPDELTRSVRAAVRGCLDQLGGRPVAGIGLSSQRESLVVWERRTGRPLLPVLSWQDSRAAAVAARVSGEQRVYALSGLPLDPMFSASKASWALDQVDPRRELAGRGELCLGTVDSWLLSTPDEHVTEIGNASRTQLLDVTTGDWSDELLACFAVPRRALPEVRASGGRFPSGALAEVTDAPVTAVLGDSHAALFGHGVRSPGSVKVTYGTGSSAMGLTDTPPADRAGLALTIAWQLAGDAPRRLALEGNIRASGATVAWVARLLELTPGEVAALGAQADSDGVHLVPGFTGLGAPWWDREATGLVSGLSLGSGRAQLARAALEAIAFQVGDLLDAVRATGTRLGAVLADGGASTNDTLMQLQADLAGVTVERPAAAELSALGAAHLAGLQAGLWDEATLSAQRGAAQLFHGRITDDERRGRIDAWHRAVARARMH